MEIDKIKVSQLSEDTTFDNVWLHGYKDTHGDKRSIRTSSNTVLQAIDDRVKKAVDAIDIPKGEKGERGLPGVKGDKGDRGTQGIQGERGDRGTQGVQGERGAQGLKGDKGDAGKDGPVYKAGENIEISEDNVISASGSGKIIVECRDIYLNQNNNECENPDGQSPETAFSHLSEILEYLETHEFKRTEWNYLYINIIDGFSFDGVSIPSLFGATCVIINGQATGENMAGGGKAMLYNSYGAFVGCRSVQLDNIGFEGGYVMIEFNNCNVGINDASFVSPVIFNNCNVGVMGSMEISSSVILNNTNISINGLKFDLENWHPNFYQNDSVTYNNNHEIDAMFICLRGTNLNLGGLNIDIDESKYTKEDFDGTFIYLDASSHADFTNQWETKTLKDHLPNAKIDNDRQTSIKKNPVDQKGYIGATITNTISTILNEKLEVNTYTLQVEMCAANDKVSLADIKLANSDDLTINADAKGSFNSTTLVLTNNDKERKVVFDKRFADKHALNSFVLPANKTAEIIIKGYGEFVSMTAIALGGWEMKTL